MVLRLRFVRWALVGVVLAGCSSSDEQLQAPGASGMSGINGTSGKGAGGTQSGGSSGAGGTSRAGTGGGGASSPGGSGVVAGESGSDGTPSSGGMSASGTGGSISIGPGGSAGGTQGLAGAGSGNESEGGAPSDACLGETSNFGFPPECTTARAPLGEEIAPCEFALPKPSGVSLDFNGINVTYTSDFGSSFVPRATPSECDEAPAGGFYYGDKAEPVSIVLCPCTCAAAADGGGELEALYGCPTIVR